MFQVEKIMEKFEKQFEDLDVRTSVSNFVPFSFISAGQKYTSYICIVHIFVSSQMQLHIRWQEDASVQFTSDSIYSISVYTVTGVFAFKN